jgi:hypothetical protein
MMYLIDCSVFSWKDMKNAIASWLTLVHRRLWMFSEVACDLLTY